MATVVASRSGQLARPGAHLDELEETDALSVDMTWRDAPSTMSDEPADRDDASAREIRWVCEWWPPT